MAKGIIKRQLYRMFLEDKIPVRPYRNVRKPFPPALVRCTGFEIYPNLNSIRWGLKDYRNIGFSSLGFSEILSLEGSSQVVLISTGNNAIRWTNTSGYSETTINQSIAVGRLFLSRFYYADNTNKIKYVSGAITTPQTGYSFPTNWLVTAVGTWGQRLVVNRRDSNQHTFYFSDTGGTTFNITDNWIQIHTNVEDPIIGFVPSNWGMWIICRYSLWKVDGLLPNDTVIRKVGDFYFGDEFIRFRAVDTPYGLIFGGNDGLYIAKGLEIKRYYGVPSVNVDRVSYKANKLLYRARGGVNQWYILDLQTEEAVTLHRNEENPLGDEWLWDVDEIVFLEADTTVLKNYSNTTARASIEIETDDFEFDSSVLVMIDKIGISGKLGKGILTVKYEGNYTLDISFDKIDGYKWFRLPPYITSTLRIRIKTEENPQDAYLNHIDFLVKPRYKKVNEINW